MPIIFFDSTGSIHKDIPDQKKPFLYSLVFHDTIKHKILPLAEFISTAHDQITIGKYLSSIKSILEQNKVAQPKIIVTDMSWALINSVLLIFNNCNILNYLNYCYLILTQNKQELNQIIKVKYYLCSTHFFKNIKKKVKKLDIPKDSRILFLFSIVLLQNAINLKQIDIYLKHIHNIFCNKFFDESVKQSIDYLHRELKNKNLNDYDIEDARILPEQSIRDQEFETFLEESKVFIDLNYEDSIKNNSPFTKFYNEKLMYYAFEITINNPKNELNNVKENSLSNYELFRILWGELYLIPIWSGIMINNEKISYSIKSRLSNNAVENYFSILKNKILNGIKFLSTSELVSKLYRHLYARYSMFYNDNSNFQLENQMNKNQQIEEKWIDKNIKRKHAKNFFYKNFDITSLKSINNEEKIEKMAIDNNDHLTKLDDDKIFQNKEKLMAIKKLVKIVEHSTVSFNFIKKSFNESKQILNEFFQKIRNLSLIKYSNQDINEPNRKKLQLSDDYYPIDSTGNGNCLYNSISILLFGNEELYYLIKICSIFIILENETFFNHLIYCFKFELEYEKFIKKTCKKKEYGSTLNLVAISLLLDKTINCFVESKRTNTSVYHVYSIRKNKSEKIILGCINEHFFPILIKSNNLTLDNKECIVLAEYDFEERFIDLYMS